MCTVSKVSSFDMIMKRLCITVVPTTLCSVFIRGVDWLLLKNKHFIHKKWKYLCSLFVICSRY